MTTRPLVVMHLPKTGGTTLRHAVEAAAADEQIVTLYGRDDVQRFISDESRRAGVEVVVGHVSYGLHRWLPPSTRYVTMLRDPIDRAVSEYWFIRHHAEHPEHARARRVDLAGFCRWRAAQGGANAQTALIARSEGLHAGQPPVTDTDLACALDRIERRFAVVGLSDRFDEALAAICVVAGWAPPRYLNRNVTPSRPRVEELAGADRSLLEELHALDLQLVATARARFDALVAGQGVAHAEALADLRARNGRAWRRVRDLATAAASLRHRMRRVSRPR